MVQRRMRLAAAAFILAAGGLGVGPAHADDNASQVCSALGNAGTTHGGCVSLVHGNPTALLSDLCGRDVVQQAAGTTNRGQCLKATRALLP